MAPGCSILVLRGTETTLRAPIPEIKQSKNQTPVDSRPKPGHARVRCLPKVSNHEKTALIQGTLDLLILRTLAPGTRHGQGIARAIQQQSSDVFLVDHGSALSGAAKAGKQRLDRGDWGVSENNRRARFYKLTARGRKQLAEKTNEWHRVANAIARILAPGKAEV